MNASETAPPVLRKTYLWDPLESPRRPVGGLDNFEEVAPQGRAANGVAASQPIATRVLAMSIFDETGAYVEDLYYTHDALKNTTALFGILAGRRALYEYGPYGSTVKMEGNAAEVNPFRFSSEYFDEETGLAQYNFRYYSPKEGRWTGREPMDDEPVTQPYVFVNNTSTSQYDVLGLFGIFGAIAGAVVDYGMQVAVNYATGNENPWTDVDMVSIGVSAAAGAIGIPGALKTGSKVLKTTKEIKKVEKALGKGQKINKSSKKTNETPKETVKTTAKET